MSCQRFVVSNFFAVLESIAYARTSPRGPRNIGIANQTIGDFFTALANKVDVNIKITQSAN